MTHLEDPMPLDVGIRVSWNFFIRTSITHLVFGNTKGHTFQVDIVKLIRTERKTMGQTKKHESVFEPLEAEWKELNAQVPMYPFYTSRYR